MSSIKYPYLNDSKFLMNFIEQANVEQTVKITVLNFAEKPIQSIEGRVTAGNINLDGNSSMRRTANLTVFIEEENAEFMKIGGIFSLNKKIKIEIGVSNHTSSWREYPILWFPQGIYVIMGVNITHSTTGSSVTLQLKDKMVFLNGECGGTLPAMTVFHEYETLDPSTGEYVLGYPTIVQIIQEMVNHFGSEPLNKIIINDLDTRVKKPMKWMQPYPLYQVNHGEGSEEYCRFQLDQPGGVAGVDYHIYETGQDIGYVYTDFIYPGELIGQPGESVCTILDKIKSLLGNYEYFYDLDGNFVFQEIKNYLNTSKATIDIRNMNQQDYIVDRGKGNALYVFNKNNIVTSYANTPQYNMIKNDFIVWGERKSVDGEKIPIRYHLVIDKKPELGNDYYHLCQYREWNELTETYDYTYKAAHKFQGAEQFPYPGEEGVYYAYRDKENNISLYYWDSSTPAEEASTFSARTILPSFIPQLTGKDENNKVFTYPNYYHFLPQGDNLTIIKDYKPKDWRILLLFGLGFLNQGNKNENNNSNNDNVYQPELGTEWPPIYDIEEDKFKEEVINKPDTMNYFLDFIDSDAAISEFSISNIGRRSKVIKDDTVNCIFEHYIPDVILLKTGEPNLDNLRNECVQRQQRYTQVDENVYNGLLQGGTQNSAYNAVRDLLYQYTQYNEAITVQTLPMYFLQPNTRITVEDSVSGIHGDYMINRISVPLTINGTMTLSCTRAVTKI